MTKVSDEMLMAYVDGQLDEPERAAVERAIAEDPELRARAEMESGLNSEVKAWFDPVAAEPLPPALAGLFEQRGEVVDFASAREKKARRFAWPQLGAMAASLAVGLLAGQMLSKPAAGPVEVESDTMLARGELAEALQTRLASQPQDNGTRVLMSFEDQSGRLCRTFDASAVAGIACREEKGWAVVLAATGNRSQTDYRQASSAVVMEQAQAMMAGDPLDAEAERKASSRGWRR